MTSTFDIYFNSERSYNKGLYVVRRPDIPAPEPIYEPYEIPGHDGILMPVDMRYGPLEIDVEMNFMSSDPNTWGDAYRVAKEWLHGSGQLYFSDDTAMFYNVYMVSIVDSERVSRRIGAFTARFVCEPYTYSKAGDRFVRLDMLSDNPFQETAKPSMYIEPYAEYDEHLYGTTHIIKRGTGERFSVETVSKYNNYHIDFEKGIVLAQHLTIDGRYEQEIWNTHASGNFEDFYLPYGSTAFYSIATPRDEGSTYKARVSIMPRWRAL